MRVRLTSTVVATVLFGSMLAEPCLGQVRSSSDVDELRERHQDPRRPRTDEEPDARKYKSLTPEERRERTMRRKLRRVDELMEKGKYGEGAALLESLRVGRSAREFAHVQNTLAFAYSQSDQPEKAIGYYERLLRIPALPESIGLPAERQLAQLYYEQGREQIWDEDAEPWFRKALASMKTWMGKSPERGPEDYLFLSRVQVELNDLQSGIASLEAAIRLAEEQGLPIEEEWDTLLNRMKSAGGEGQGSAQGL
ncbi:MAG: hypothetical protein OXH68_04400 [Gammaproteobacteria bacterium]|nr:hypothetical protein [Gammaproteobacteria bacterium]